MRVTIQPSQLKGVIQAPASKSSMQRACAAALLNHGSSIVHYPGFSNDDKAAIGIIKTLGASVEVKHEKLLINGNGFPKNGTQNSQTITCGESGLSLRMFTPIASLLEKEITINGSGSLLTRPIDLFDEILPLLQVRVKTNDGKLPLYVQGPLVPADIEVDGSLSSQFLTGLLMAFSASPYLFRNNDSVTGGNKISIKVKNLRSKPYIDLTLDVMKKFGMRVPENINYEEFVYTTDSVPDLKKAPVEYTVEADWSGGAFLLVAGAIAGPITVRGLDLSSTQADRAITDAMMQANAAIAMEAKGIKIHPGGLRAFDFDATDCPDLFPPLAALAAYCNGNSRIKGVSRLAHKESNRAMTLKKEFEKMSVTIDLDDDFMIIHGGDGISGTRVSSHHDHRIVMACAVAALKADGETEIEDAQAVQKSYPEFFNDLKSLGASVSLPFQQVNL